MTTVTTTTNTTADPITEPLMHWPNTMTNPMTPAEVEAWVVAEVERGRVRAAGVRATWYAKERERVQAMATAMAENAAKIVAELNEREAAEVPTFDVDCPVCGDYGGLGDADPEHPDHYTVRQHIEWRMDGCDPERWGKTVPLAKVLEDPEDYNLTAGSWQIITG